MHITVAHPGLTRLFGQSYGVEAQPWVDKMWGFLRDIPSAQLSERLYQALLPERGASAGRAAAAVDLLQAVAECRLRHLSGPDRFHAVDSDLADRDPDPRDCLCASRRRREMRAARYLNWRINRRVSLEDKALIERVQSGMGSRSYSPGPLGRNEVSLRSFAQRMRN